MSEQKPQETVSQAANKSNILSGVNLESLKVSLTPVVNHVEAFGRGARTTYTFGLGNTLAALNSTSSVLAMGSVHTTEPLNLKEIKDVFNYYYAKEEKRTASDIKKYPLSTYAGFAVGIAAVHTTVSGAYKAFNVEMPVSTYAFEDQANLVIQQYNELALKAGATVIPKMGASTADVVAGVLAPFAGMGSLAMTISEHHKEIEVPPAIKRLPNKYR